MEESSTNIEFGAYINDNQYRSTVSLLSDELLNGAGMQLKTECRDNSDNKVTSEIIMDKEGPHITMSGDFYSDKGITLVLAPTDANGKSYEYEFQQYGIVYRIRDAHGDIIHETNVFGNDQE